MLAVPIVRASTFLHVGALVALGPGPSPGLYGEGERAVLPPNGPSVQLRTHSPLCLFLLLVWEMLTMSPGQVERVLPD